MQRKSVALFKKLLIQAPYDQKALYEQTLKYAELHAMIIERFGRFPHRNAILGRKMLPEEIEFLQQPNSAF